MSLPYYFCSGICHYPITSVRSMSGPHINCIQCYCWLAAMCSLKAGLGLGVSWFYLSPHCGAFVTAEEVVAADNTAC